MTVRDVVPSGWFPAFERLSALRLGRAWWAWLVVGVVTVLSLPTTAAAESSPSDVAVFQLEAPAGSKDVADELTSILRDEAAGDQKYRIVNEDPVTVSDVLVILGCSEPTAACLKKAAGQFDAELVIFGKLQSTGQGDRVIVRLFDASRGRYVRSFRYVVSDEERSYDDFRREVRTLLEIKQERRKSWLDISADVKGATVLLDGRDVGRTPVRLEDVSEGRHTVVIEHPEYRRWETDIDFHDGSKVRVRAPLEPKEAAQSGQARAESAPGDDEAAEGPESAQRGDGADARPRGRPDRGRTPLSEVGPWVAIGAGVVALGGSAVAWSQVKRAERDLKAWREDSDNWEQTRRVGGDCVGDECAIISRGESAETMHRVLLGVGGAGVAGGLLWLVLRKDRAPQKTSRFQMMFGARHVGARWRW